MNNSDKKIIIYDTTLREGMQNVGISYTVKDKIRLAKLLDKIGVSYIEGGIPGANPKDDEFYREISSVKLQNAKVTAFGSTCHPGMKPEDDLLLKALINAGTESVCIFGKSWILHVKDILGCSAEENLRIIRDSVAFLKNSGKEVIFDAEHFFDGYKEDKSYALQTIAAAFNGGADYVVLCETNGGVMPGEFSAILDDVIAEFPDKKNFFGVHVHNDSGMAVANSVIAAEKGISMVQVTLNGWGERCGNADLFSVVPNLQLKCGFDCVDNIAYLSEAAAKASNIADIKLNKSAPYVGSNAFCHKAGMHIDAVMKNPTSYEHITPEKVGATSRFMISEISGKAAVIEKIKKLLPDVAENDIEPSAIAEKIKKLESEGYQFEDADASFEIMVRRLLGIQKEWFKLESYKVVNYNQDEKGKSTASAVVDVFVDGEEEVTAANGIGPVDALDGAFRKALGRFYPQISQMRLVDYKVRVLDTKQATASVVRVVIESTDGESVWSTVGVSADIIEASFYALTDSHEFFLNKNADK